MENSNLVYSLQKIINVFKIIAENHQEIESFGYGFEIDIEKQNQSNQLYRQFWVQPLNTQVILSRNNVVNDRRFRLWCYDLIKQDGLNDISVWNQTEAVLIDVIRQFNYGSNEYKVGNSPLLMPVGEMFGEVLTGYYAEVSIQTAEAIGVCEIPIK